MNKSATAIFLLALLAAAPAAAEHDLFLCAAINKNYVIGSKLVTPNGLFRRLADGTFEHFGLNFPGILNFYRSIVHNFS